MFQSSEGTLPTDAPGGPVGPEALLPSVRWKTLPPGRGLGVLDHCTLLVHARALLVHFNLNTRAPPLKVQMHPHPECGCTHTQSACVSYPECMCIHTQSACVSHPECMCTHTQSACVLHREWMCTIPRVHEYHTQIACVPHPECMCTHTQNARTGLCGHPTGWGG